MRFPDVLLDVSKAFSRHAQDIFEHSRGVLEVFGDVLDVFGGVPHRRFQMFSGQFPRRPDAFSNISLCLLE